MNVLEGTLDKLTALTIGATAIAFGAPTGLIEAGVGAAGLIGFVLGRREKFGPECAKVRARIQKDMLKSYGQLVSGSDGDENARTELEAANEALNQALEKCVIDRAALAAAAVSPRGFPKQAVAKIMAGLSEANAELFSPAKADGLAFRFAWDVVRAGVKAAVANADYYRQLEPHLMFEMARALGEVGSDVKEIRLSIEQIRDEYRRELDLAKTTLHATESDLIALISNILQQRVARENLQAALEQSYPKLVELRARIGDLQSLANEVPEIAGLLEQADEALGQSKQFSLEDAEKALAVADSRYAEIVAAREETVRLDKQNRARILGKRAEIAAVRFDYAAAVSFSRERSVLLTAALGPNNPETISSHIDLASNLDLQGRYTEAEPLFRDALAYFENLFGPSDPLTVGVGAKVAINFQAQGRYNEAERYSRKVLEYTERMFGADHADMITANNNLAATLNAQGRYADAESLFRTTLEATERTLGQDHPDTAASYNNLASNLVDQQRETEAEPLYRKALEIRKRILGQDHPDTAASYDHLATSLDGQGRHAEADPLHRKALEIRERVFGADHLTTVASQISVAFNLDARGQHVEAEPLLRRALEMRNRLLGPDHPGTAFIHNGLAANLTARGLNAESELHFRKSQEICERVLGPDHPNTAASHSNLGSNLNLQERYAEAEPLLRKALEMRERLLRPNHPDTAASYDKLAFNLNAQGRNAEAEPFLHKASAIRERKFAIDHPSAATIQTTSPPT